jgi:hypothetical protein
MMCRWKFSRGGALGTVLRRKSGRVRFICVPVIMPSCVCLSGLRGWRRMRLIVVNRVVCTNGMQSLHSLRTPRGALVRARGLNRGKRNGALLFLRAEPPRTVRSRGGGRPWQRGVALLSRMLAERILTSGLTPHSR